MKKIPFLAILLSTLSFVFLFACGAGNPNPSSEETASEEASLQTVDPVEIFKNEYAQVVKVTLQPGERLAAHKGENRLIYSLTDYSIDWVEKGKEEGIKSWNQGDTHAHEAGEHAAQNSGETTAEWLAFVRRNAELPECGNNTAENDVNKAAPDFATLLFENEDFRVSEVKLPPSGKIPRHSGINRVIYSLSDYTILFESNNQGTVQKSFRKGEAHWHEACLHALENIGETEARFLVVSYKRSQE